MKKISIISLLALFVFIIISCVYPQGIEKQSREVEPFNGIKVSSGIKLYLTQGDETKVFVEADGSIIGDLITKNEKGILNIYISTKKLLRFDPSPKVYVTFSWLNSITASAGSEVIGQNAFKADKLEVQNSSGSYSKFEVECRDLTLRASSGAKIKLMGSSLNLEAKSSSGSEIRVRDLKVVNAKLDASSGANIDAYVSGEIEASASSGGRIDYSGEAIPKLLQQSSGGNIRN